MPAKMARAMRRGNAAAAEVLASSSRGDPAGALNLARSGNRSPLPHRSALQAQLGVDLSNIEAYCGGPAKEATDQVGAQAFAVKNVVVFGDDSPSIDIVRHEVTHVQQQGGLDEKLGSTPSSLGRTSRGQAEERQAEASQSGIHIGQ